MRYNIRKMTYEDRFDRRYRCNARRFLPDTKRSNRREFRRRIKKGLVDREIAEITGRCRETIFHWRKRTGRASNRGLK